MAQIIDGINQIDVEELKKILESDERKNYKIIDVREPHEYNAGHIPGIPLLPMNSIPAVLDKLDKDENYLFICRSGNRSHHVSRFMKANGFEKVTNFSGGMLVWNGPIKTGMDE